MIRPIYSILNDDASNNDFSINDTITKLKSSIKINETISSYLYNENTQDRYEIAVNRWEINQKIYIAIVIPKTETVIGYFEYYTSEEFTDRKFSDPFEFGNLIIDISRSGIKIANLELVWFADDLPTIVPNIRADLIFQALIFTGFNDAIVIKAPTFKSEYLTEVAQLVFSFEECSLAIHQIDIRDNSFEFHKTNHVESMDEYRQIISNSENQRDLMTSSIMIIKSDVYEIM